MNRIQSTLIVAAFSTLFAGQALAGEAAQGLSREQVKAELSEAIRTGNVFDAATNQLLKDAYPARYSKAAQAQAAAPAQAKAEAAKAQAASTVQLGKTRQQVLDELAEAIRTGDVLDTATGLQMKEAYPHLYPQAATAHAQVKPATEPAAAAQTATTQTVGLRR